MGTSRVSSFRVYLRVIETWFYTLIGLSGLLVIALITIFLTSRFVNPRISLAIWAIAGLFALLIFIFSKILVVNGLNLQKAKPEDYPDFHGVTEEICQRFWFTKNIPLYIWNDLSMNACAFGPGFGFAGIAITKSLYQTLSREELKAVVAHEIAHIRCKDVGISTFPIVLSAAISMLSKWMIFVGSTTSTLRSPSLIIGHLLKFISEHFLPICFAAIHKEREYTADTLASLYCGTGVHLISALRKICGDQIKETATTAFDHLKLSHPLIANRIANLEEGEILVREKKEGVRS